MLCIIFVAYAPREGELGLTETDEVRHHTPPAPPRTHAAHARGPCSTVQFSTHLNPRRWRVLLQIDVMWWPRFILSILLYGGSLVALLAYVKDVVFFTVDRKTRVVVR